MIQASEQSETRNPQSEIVFMTPRQVAQRLGISPDSVANLIRSHQLEAILVSRSVRSRRRNWRVSPEALERFIKARTVTPPPPKPPKRRPYKRYV